MLRLKGLILWLCTEPSLEPGSRMHKPDDGRPDFVGVSGGAGRLDGMPMKPASGWDAEEAARLKSSMMNREKMVSVLPGLADLNQCDLNH